MKKKDPVKWYNDIMFSICAEHLSIGTEYSENTDGWNLRDMVSEMQYMFDFWNEETSIAYDEAHDPDQPPGRPWYKTWYCEKQRMKRFIDAYKSEAMEMKCIEKHCSKYD